MKSFKNTIACLLLAFVSQIAVSREAIPNAGFEDWSSPAGLKSWETSNKFGQSFGFTPVTRSTDSHSGQYAIKLSTLDTKVGPNLPGVACLGILGYYEVSGGTEFHDRPVKLRGYYKLPNDGDTISIMVILKKLVNDSAKIIAEGEFISIEKTSGYQYFECNINYLSGESPDLLNIILMTGNTIGSTLLADDLEFEYEASGTGYESGLENIYPEIYPNPAFSTVILKFGSESYREISIFDSGLNQVKSINDSGALVSIDMTGLAPGCYLYVIKSDGQALNGRFMFGGSR